MDLTVAIELIKKYTLGHSNFVSKATIAERYYRNKNDILFGKKKDAETEAVRNADNRICSSFYSLIVNQKAGYMFTYPPMIDIGNSSSNKYIQSVLGDAYAKNCKKLCVNSANAGIAWVHYWIDDKNRFRWAVIDSKEIIPVYNNDLEKKLISVLRVYMELEEETGRHYMVYEIWTETECATYKRYVNEGLDRLMELARYPIGFDIPRAYTNVLNHNFGQVPFISFANNDNHTSDLEPIKGHIDTYDKVYSGFINDLEDIQEIIFILSGYAGESLSEFLGNLKKYKTIKLDENIDGKGDLKTLTIDIPVEARKELLSISRKAIFEQGQAVDPEPSNFGNASGVALKYLYSLLELKSGLTETEFRLGFAELVRAICRHANIQCNEINQVWTRNSITNDTELADIASKSTGIISQKTVLQNHPWVDDAEKEIAELKKETNEKIGDYGFPKTREEE